MSSEIPIQVKNLYIDKVNEAHSPWYGHLPEDSQHKWEIFVHRNVDIH
jgi:hypothetical protein